MIQVFRNSQIMYVHKEDLSSTYSELPICVNICFRTAILIESKFRKYHSLVPDFTMLGS